jgi:hypothetical protein
MSYFDINRKDKFPHLSQYSKDLARNREGYNNEDYIKEEDDEESGIIFYKIDRQLYRIICC